MRTVMIIAALAALSACVLHAARTNVVASTTYVDAKVRDATNALPEWTKSPAKPTYTAQEVGAATPSDVLGEVRDAMNALPSWTKSPAKPTYTAQEVGAATPSNVLEEVRSATNALPAWTKSPAKPVYTAQEVGATDGNAVTNIMRGVSRGGVWDSQLQVWWTPIMQNGALKYMATTNVDLSAEGDQ